MPLNFLVDNIAGAAAGLLKTMVGIGNAGNAIFKTVGEVAGHGYNLMTKYWYIPVIIGGVIVGYFLIRKSPAAQAAEIVKVLSSVRD